MTSRPAIPRLLLTPGDPGGIGPEVALKALLREPPDGSWRATLVGPRGIWMMELQQLAMTEGVDAGAVERLRASVGYLDSPDPEAGQSHVLVNFPTARGGEIAAGAVEVATRAILAGDGDALVTGPLSKEGLKAAGLNWPGHTEMLRDLAGVPRTTMAFVGGGLVVALTTVHIPLRAVFDALTVERIVDTAEALESLLMRLGLTRPQRLRAPRPRLALAGLNPHAGENGLFGDEETTLLAPALEESHARGIDLVGPLPPDTIFVEALRGSYDGVVALYHDQALIAVKTLAFDEAVNVTIGLPFVRTSPDHGTAWDIAGQGIAREDSFLAAVRLARRLAQGTPNT